MTYITVSTPISSVRGEPARTCPADQLVEETLSKFRSVTPLFSSRIVELLAETQSYAELNSVALKLAEQGEQFSTVALHACLNQLCSMRRLKFSSKRTIQDSLVTLEAVNHEAKLPYSECLKRDEIFRLSRFSLVLPNDETSVPGRRSPGSGLVVENPICSFRWRLPVGSRGRTAAKFLSLITEGTSIETLVQSRFSKTEAQSAVELLHSAGLLLKVGSDGNTDEDLDTTKRQWEPHDLWFHTRSRLGFHDQPIGGDFRFQNDIEPQPSINPSPQYLAEIDLPQPNPQFDFAGEPTLFEAMESRVSKRPSGRRPLTLIQLSFFLWRTARIKRSFNTDFGEFTSRPYPSGGGSYENDLYLTIANVNGLSPGFYFYNALEHKLLQLVDWNDDCKELLEQAILSTANSTVPDIVITISARFQRVSWKYSGMAYATQLKNVGCQYMAFYLAATALRLSPCGLGLGSTRLFARLSRRPMLKEGSIGEFALSGADY